MSYGLHTWQMLDDCNVCELVCKKTRRNMEGWDDVLIWGRFIVVGICPYYFGEQCLIICLNRFFGEKMNEQDTGRQTFACAPCVAAMWHLFIGQFWIRLLYEYEFTSCLFGEYVECHMLTKGWWHLSDLGSPAEVSFLIQLFCLCVCDCV